MKLLSLFVAVVSVACLLVGGSSALHLPFAAENGSRALLLGVAALLCAAATWQSAPISSFLRIFVTIFAIETALFGAIFLLDLLGFMPAAFSDYSLPASLPVSVAVFAIIVYGVSHIPVIRAITRIADHYYSSNEPSQVRLWPLPVIAGPERWFAAAMITFLVLINQAQVAIMVRLSFFNRDWFNAIQEKNGPDFWRLLMLVFAPWAFIYVMSAVVEYVVKSHLIIRWRRTLTWRYVNRWLDGPIHYRMSLAGSGTDNPDQRISEDIYRFIDGGDNSYGLYSYSILLISTLSSLVSFSIILWLLSANFTIPGTQIPIPGFLFWVALIYASVSTLITHWIGRSLVGLFFTRQVFEANFRFSLARLREYGEQVALLSGEAAERRSVMGRFTDILRNYLTIVTRQKRLLAFTNLYGQISPIIPYIFTAPFYFSGKIALGVMTQTASAFGRVESSLNFFVSYYTSLADFRSVLNRLTGFDQSIERAHGLDRAGPRLIPSAGDLLEVSDLDVALPDGRRLLAGVSFTVPAHASTLFVGPSGSGKSTLFRAISGIWPHATGRIAFPAGAGVMLLPQKPYIPIGTLRHAVTYPAPPEAFGQAAIEAALDAVRLDVLTPSLDIEDNWSQRLSGGEQQRLAIARALLAAPDWLFLDEATAALDEASEAAVYQALAQRLPGTTIVSIGHRSTLLSLHQRRVDMQSQGDGTFTTTMEPATSLAGAEMSSLPAVASPGARPDSWPAGGAAVPPDGNVSGKPDDLSPGGSRAPSGGLEVL